MELLLLLLVACCCRDRLRTLPKPRLAVLPRLHSHVYPPQSSPPSKLPPHPQRPLSSQFLTGDLLPDRSFSPCHFFFSVAVLAGDGGIEAGLPAAG